MSKVARMTDGLKRRQTYEEVIEYIDNDKKLDTQTVRQSK